MISFLFGLIGAGIVAIAVGVALLAGIFWLMAAPFTILGALFGPESSAPP